MTISLDTPSKMKKFEAEIDLRNSEIIVTSAKGFRFKYHCRALIDLYVWLKFTQKGEWIFLGTKNENEVPKRGTVEEWARSKTNPIGGYYGKTQGRRGRFTTFILPILTEMGLAEIEDRKRNIRVRAI